MAYWHTTTFLLCQSVIFTPQMSGWQRVTRQEWMEMHILNKQCEAFSPISNSANKPAKWQLASLLESILGQGCFCFVFLFLQ